MCSEKKLTWLNSLSGFSHSTSYEWRSDWLYDGFTCSCSIVIIVLVLSYTAWKQLWTSSSTFSTLWHPNIIYFLEATYFLNLPFLFLCKLCYPSSALPYHCSFFDFIAFISVLFLNLFFIWRLSQPQNSSSDTFIRQINSRRLFKLAS